MDLARVVGTVVASVKDPSLEGVQLCILQPLDADLRPVSRPLVATEASHSRAPGDVVFYVASGDAVFTHPDGRAMPVDAAIVGSVDSIHPPPRPVAAKGGAA